MPDRDRLYHFMPQGTQRYILDWFKRSKKGCITYVGPETGLSFIQTDDDHGQPNCKAMGNKAFVYDDYKKNTYYF